MFRLNNDFDKFDSEFDKQFRFVKSVMIASVLGGILFWGAVLAIVVLALRHFGIL